MKAFPFFGYDLFVLSLLDLVLVCVKLLSFIGVRFFILFLVLTTSDTYIRCETKHWPTMILVPFETDFSEGSCSLCRRRRAVMYTVA